MALTLGDRVQETTTTTGTGTITLAGAKTGYQAASSVLSNADTTYYAIQHQTADEWEVGLGTYTSSGTTLARTTVISSSNSNNAVDFAAGTKDVFVTMPASKMVYLDASGSPVGLAPAHVIQEEGSNLTARSKLNFVGGAVTATDDSGNDATKVTIAPSGASLPLTRSDGSTSDPIALTSAALGENLVSDTTPQLGGNLDVNGQSIVSDGSNENIPITPHGTGSVVISKADINAGAIDGTAIGAASASTGAFTTLDATGDISGSTVNADGDTSAGDNAAMGYTSTEGLILTGQGSTSDVTIKNDADATVLSVPTGTTSLNVPLMTGAHTFGTNGGGSTAPDISIVVEQYATAESEGWRAFHFGGSSSSHVMRYGGGSATYNCATHHTFHTAADVSTREGTERMRIAPDGNITKPTHCAFSGRSADASNETGDGTVYTITFGTEKYDLNGNLSGTTFTAPVDGRYSFNGKVRLGGITSSHTAAYISLVTSNEAFTVHQSNPYASNISAQNQLNWAFDCYMDASDTATVTIAVSNGSKVCEVFGGSFFNGFLIA